MNAYYDIITFCSTTGVCIQIIITIRASVIITNLENISSLFILWSNFFEEINLILPSSKNKLFEPQAMIRRVPGSTANPDHRFTAPLIIDTYREEDEIGFDELEVHPKDFLVNNIDSIGQASNRAQWQYVVSSLAVASLVVCCVLLAVGVFTTTTG